MEWQNTIQLWNQRPVQVLDIRHLTMKPGEQRLAYRLPANAFVYANQGSARLEMEELEAPCDNGYLLHSGKGANLSIWCGDEPFDYYLVLYKPRGLINNQVRHGDLEQQDVFGRRYVFEVMHALSLLSLLEQMSQLWESSEELDRLQVTGIFYQFVVEQFRQLQMVKAEAAVPELPEQIAEYIHEYFQKTVTMETMAAKFHYSTHYLARVFKRKFGCSPMEYLLQTRINRAKYLLTETDMPIRSLAEKVGYTDIYYFSRLFKKLTGVTPTQFKKLNLGSIGSIRPKMMPESFIAPQAGQGYIDNNENHYQHNTWRVNEMKWGFKPSFAVTLLFSLSLLLAACGGTAAEPQQSAQGSNAQPNATATADAASESPAATTRMYKDALGREVEIPSNPSKVVVITYGGYLLPLGLQPVGVDQAVLDHYPEELAGVASIGEGLGNVEAVSALEPDLIILPEYHDPAAYTQFEKIAPTVAVSWGGDPDVINTLRDMGDIMNRKQEAEAWIAKFEAKLQSVRDQLEVKVTPGETAITFILYQGELFLGGEGGTLGKLIYEDFGYQMPEQFKQYADGGAALSMESLADRPADYFFTQMTDEELVEMNKLFQEPLYQSIPAIKNNRIINVSRDKWNYGPYLAEQAVDEMIEKVAQLQK
ncbi:helix-turn-helix domain-containing protein [Paenibacillus sp. FSL H8-0537]|uniref:helix-turn-helix domain-containing protein n=1 Tax=Paenibacillus sp. FSL H8-0537 TaxID=2921399 RepID=UPI003101318C